jgi:hypothetical protein
MARNMIDANTKVFGRFAEVAKAALSPELIAARRAIATDKESKRWLKNVEVFSTPQLSLGLNSKFAIASLDGEKFILSIGVDVESPPADFEPVPINAGAFTAFVAELDVGFIRAPDLVERLREYVFYPPSEEIETIDVEVVRSFFVPLQLFRIHNSSPLVCDSAGPYRAALVAVLGAPSIVGLPWASVTLERLNAMARKRPI